MTERRCRRFFQDLRKRFWAEKDSHYLAWAPLAMSLRSEWKEMSLRRRTRLCYVSQEGGKSCPFDLFSKPKGRLRKSLQHFHSRCSDRIGSDRIGLVSLFGLKRPPVGLMQCKCRHTRQPRNNPAPHTCSFSAWFHSSSSSISHKTLFFFPHQTFLQLFGGARDEALTQNGAEDDSSSF